MGFDVLLIAVIVGGIGLSAAYVGAEYCLWREQGAAQRRREAALRDLHAARLSEQHDLQLLPSVLRLQGFGEDRAANPGHAADLEARGSSARTDSPRQYPFAKRRERVTKRACQ
jgi:hypothetical protein